MRSVAVLLLLALPCGADEPELGAEDAARIRWLVEQFRDAEPARRQLARECLLEYGEDILPFLQTLRGADPEVVRTLREMTRGTRKLKLRLLEPEGPHALGSPLRLTLRLVNDSDNTYLIPLTRGPDARRGGILSAFELFVEERHVNLSEDDVEIPAAAMAGVEAWGRPLPQVGPAVLVSPGRQVLVRVTLEGDDVPFRRPGKTAAWVGLVGTQVHQWIGVAAPSGAGTSTLLDLGSNEVQVRATGRKAAELEAMLESGDPKRVASALAEVRIREDDEVLPVLRRRADDPALRLAAVQRLGAAGHEDDFGFIYGCTRDPELEIRRAAVRALASYPVRKARSRLIGLALGQDHELKLDAIKALRSHRDAATIDCFVRLLILGREEGAVAKEMLDALYEWTDKVVEYRKSELESFERWWMKNREAWVRNPPPR